MNEDLLAAGLDSMEAVELLLELEDEFRITLPDEYLVDETFRSTGTLWTVVSSLAEDHEVK